MSFLSEALAWALRQAGPGSRLIQATRLKGGISSIVDKLEIVVGICCLVEILYGPKRLPNIRIRDREREVNLD